MADGAPKNDECATLCGHSMADPRHSLDPYNTKQHIPQWATARERKRTETNGNVRARSAPPQSRDWLKMSLKTLYSQEMSGKKLQRAVLLILRIVDIYPQKINLKEIRYMQAEKGCEALFELQIYVRYISENV